MCSSHVLCSLCVTPILWFFVITWLAIVRMVCVSTRSHATWNRKPVCRFSRLEPIHHRGGLSQPVTGVTWHHEHACNPLRCGAIRAFRRRKSFDSPKLIYSLPLFFFLPRGLVSLVYPRRSKLKLNIIILSAARTGLISITLNTGQNFLTLRYSCMYANAPTVYRAVERTRERKKKRKRRENGVFVETLHCN